MLVKLATSISFGRYAILFSVSVNVTFSGSSSAVSASYEDDGDKTLTVIGFFVPLNIFSALETCAELIFISPDRFSQFTNAFESILTSRPISGTDSMRLQP